MNLISNSISPRVQKETKEQVKQTGRNLAKGSAVLVTGTVGTALLSGPKVTAQIISDTVHSAGKELTQAKFLPKVKEAFTNGTTAIKEMWSALPGKTSKVVVAATALGLAAVAVKSVVDAVKIHKNNNVSE